MFVDNIRIFARAGKGGNGLVSFRRAKFVPKGGPDGGDGGDGGSVILEVDPHTNDLRSFFYDPKLIATDGVGGQSAKKHGKNGKSVIGKVPPGTIIYRSNASSMAEATWLEREGEGIELEKIADLTEIGTRFTLCQGGLGGKGNWHFRSATNQAPTEAEMGTEGEEGVFFMELRRIADAGLVGYPNAGKSTLLGDISEAKPKVASYPFTTLQPIIGVVEFDSFRRCVVADIPGIIEGAHNNRGLGHEFLRHIERTRVMIHVVDVASTEGRDPVDDINKINKELEAYNPEIAKRPQIIAANKTDAIYVEEGEEDPVERLKKEFEPKGIPVYPISAVSGKGLKELLYAVQKKLDELPKERMVFEQEFFPEDMLLAENLPYTVEQDPEDEHRFIIEGPKIEKMLGYTNLDSEKGFAFFQRFLKDTGILDELEQAGIQEGDTVKMYGFEFDYYK